MDRRKFISLSAGALALSPFIWGCQSRKQVKGSLVGASSHLGHMMRDRSFGEPARVVRKKIVIVGAGVSGLAAGYFLQKHGEKDFILLDLEADEGGNARSGKNEVSAFPWGAHYIPTPNNDLKEYLQFLEECGVILTYDSHGLPVYNEQYLCFDPQERLYINGRWQEGLVPHFGVPETEQKQIQQFLSLMDELRQKKGVDGKDAFAIPIDHASKDPAFTELDTMTMKSWLLKHGFTSDYLHWYVNYCSRDDFGTEYDQISAWMGIHYFAARKGKGANAEHHDVLTWPEGNGFLVKKLSGSFQENIKTNSLVIQVEDREPIVRVTYFNPKNNELEAIDADECIMAVPQFIAGRLLKDPKRMATVAKYWNYTPWMVANLTVTELEEHSGVPLSWDNVFYDSISLGYVDATHEFLEQKTFKRNLTYYLPLTKSGVKEERTLAQKRSFDEWLSIIITDMKRVHPNIETALEEVNIMVWGHAMAQPLPGMVHGNIRRELALSQRNIHFAHTDLAGASIFEEAFYQGLNAANKVLSKTAAHV